MNKEPIETARDADLRHSHAAMQRAAMRAREVARKTGTLLVISRDGIIEHIEPDALEFETWIQDSRAPYGNKA